MRDVLRRCLRPGLVLALLLLVGCTTLLSPRADEDGDFAARPNDNEVIGEGPASGDRTMQDLACDLDDLERHIDWFGSVTSKVPDVWGQARLTQYREEFEKQMAAELVNFQFGLNGSISRSDQAFFASATALSFAVQPRPPVVGRVTTNKSAPPTLVPTQQTVQQEVTDAKTGTKTTTNTTLAPAPTPAAPPAPTPIQPLPVDDPSKLIPVTDPFTRTPVTLNRPAIVSQTAAITIEPTEYLAQKKRYLDFLNQLRRENEGDDTADSPGYSLNLVRVPVSILPGKRTQIGFGSEITMTATPILGEDLLPMTFRNLLINDLVTQLGFPLTQVLNEEPDQKGVSQFLNADVRRFLHIIYRLNDYLVDGNEAWKEARKKAFVDYLNNKDTEDRKALEKYSSDEMKQQLSELGIKGLVRSTGEIYPRPYGGTSSTRHYAATRLQIQNVVKRQSLAVRGLTIPSLSFSNGLDNRTAFPTSQIFDIYGVLESFEVGFGAFQAFEKLIDQQKYAHLPDIQGYLKEEARAAYQFLAANPQLWVRYCTPGLVQAIRSQQWDTVFAIRQAYRKEVALLTGSDSLDINPNKRDLINTEQIQMSKTTALGWCLMVDAALLTDRLIRDMKETASAKGLPLAGCDAWCPYFLPDPPPECRQAFNEYVKVRWPIRVFALDPYIQEQNIADSLSTRREIQLALSIAFTNGDINARQLTRFARRLEGEYETIDLNRTQVGFGHGENVFGWRFYPRYQTPDTDSNLTVFFRDMLIGGPTRNQLLRQRRLEPGMRECVAIVIMPSFVPYVTVDAVSNWFPITNPKHKVLRQAQALRLSRAVQTIKTEGGGVQDACRYRPGDFERLLRRADQLEARLPTQTLTTPVPILNTYGGFEMFANGTTDLAPELFGWYGAPGIDPAADTTTLFLVGDHFSPLRTKVIVGNEEVKPENQTMLSRQVVQVKFTKPLYALSGPNGKEVRIHLATPYGVTRELAVPWIKQVPADPPVGFSFGDAKLTALYEFGKVKTAAGGVDKTQFVPVAAGTGNTDVLKINWVAPGGMLSNQVEITCEFEFQTAALKTPCKTKAIGTVKGKTVTIDTNTLDTMARDLVKQIAKVATAFPRDPNPLASGLKSKKVTITPVGQGIAAQAAETLDQLSVEFKPTACAPRPGTARWPAATLTIPFSKKMDGTITPAPNEPLDPANLVITTTNVDLATVASVDLTLIVKASDAKTPTIKHTFKVGGPNTVDKAKGSLSLSSEELAKALIEQLSKEVLGADLAPEMPVIATMIKLKDKDQKSLTTAPLTTTNDLRIKWKEVKPKQVMPQANGGPVP